MAISASDIGDVDLVDGNQAKHCAFRKKGAAVTSTDTSASESKGDTASLTDASPGIVGQKIEKFYQGQGTGGGSCVATENTIVLLKNAGVSTFLHRRIMGVPSAESKR
jgi:hypothetical protein